MLTMRTFLSGFILLCVGVGAGVLLIAWAGARYPHAPEAVAPAPHAKLAAGPAAPPASPAIIPPDPAPSPAETPAPPLVVSGAQNITVVGTPPVPRSPSAAMANQPKFQPNGLPLGLVKDPFNPEVYKKLPGVQPPTINYDGRDMTAEGTALIQTPREPIPMPGSAPQQQLQANPGAPAQARPFPKTLEEANAALNAPASPGQQ